MAIISDNALFGIESGLTPLTIFSSSQLKFGFAADQQVYTDSTLSTPVANDSDAVGGMRDLTGNGNNIIQATSGIRPTWKKNILNGLPVIRFNGTTNALASSAFAANISQPVGFFVIARATSVSSATGIAMIGPINATNRIYCYLQNSAVEMYAGSPGAGAAVSANTWYGFNYYYNTTSTVSRINGGSDSTPYNAGSNALSGVSFGADDQSGFSKFWPGDILEAWCAVNPTSQQRSQMDTYMRLRSAAW